MKCRLLPLAVVACCGHSLAVAGPADYVFVPAVSYGERELDFKYGVSTKSDDPSLQAASLGFGYGATEFWFTEFYIKYGREGSHTAFDAVEWENKFQLTETGKYPVDVGFITEFEVPRDRAEGFEFRFGPLFQFEIDRLQLNANLLLTNISRADEGNGTYAGYQWQVKYRSYPAFEFGAQGFGDMGRWNHLAPTDLQDHRFGPALFGKINLGGRQAIVYNAALLFGASAAAPDRTFRMQAEYEF
jgi:hypothetical protein